MSTAAAAYARWDNPEYRARVLAAQRKHRARVAAGEGFIYVARVIGKPIIKIGFSLTPERRVAALRRDYKAPSRLLVAVPGTIAQERAIHQSLRGFPRARMPRNIEFYHSSVLSCAELPEGLRVAIKKARAA